MSQGSSFIRLGNDKTLLDKAITESYGVVLNNGKYTLEKVLEYIKYVGKRHAFPNMVKLNKQENVRALF